jgi:arsenate reductase/regulatory protein spx
MNNVIDFYGWNNCNTCQKAKKYLQQEGFELNYRDFFKEKFTKGEIEELLTGRPAVEMFSTRSPAVNALGLKTESLTQVEMIELMVEEPRLIKRPIVRIDGRIYFGTDVKTLAKILG